MLIFTIVGIWVFIGCIVYAALAYLDETDLTEAFFFAALIPVWPLMLGSFPTARKIKRWRNK